MLIWRKFQWPGQKSKPATTLHQAEADPEPGPHSLQFWEGRERGGSCPRKCEASRGGLMRFKDRSPCHNLEAQGEAASAASTRRGSTSSRRCGSIISEGSYTQRRTFNIDETAFYWKRTPSGTFTAREKSVPGFKASKDRPTLLLES